MSSIDYPELSHRARTGLVLIGHIDGIEGKFIEFVGDDGTGWLYRVGANKKGLFGRLQEVLK